MLKNIIFSVEDQKAWEEAAASLDHLAGTGVRAALTREGAGTGWMSLLSGEGLEFEETLFVTDSPVTAEKIQGVGGCVAALFTEVNRREGFSRIHYALEDIREVDASCYRRIYDRCRGIPIEILRTERCLIREITVEDVDALYKIYEEPSIARYMEGLFEDREEELAYTRGYIENVYGFYGYGMWVVARLDNGEVIGRAGVEYKEAAGGLEMGYMIAKPYQRQGYAREVCSAILDYARTQLGFDRVLAFVRPDNEASIGLCKKLGMAPWEAMPQVREDYLVFCKILDDSVKDGEEKSYDGLLESAAQN